MKKQHLWFLAGALVVLLLVRLAVDRRPGTASSLEDAGLPLVLEQGIDVDAINWIRVTGPGESGALVAERGAGGWSVASAHGAAADGDDVDDFLQALAGMRGELRGEGESLYAEFGVDEATAARVELGATAGEPSATLFVGGEGDSRGSHFARSAGSELIHHVVEGVADDLGLVGESRKPSPQQWVRLQLFDLPTDAVDRIEAQRPDQHWLLEKALPDGAEDGAPREWRVSMPATGLAIDGAGPGALAGRVARVRAASVLDPSSEACADEALTLRLSLGTGEDRKGLRFGEQLLDDDLVAARVDGEATCWGLKRWTADSLMPRASQLVELGKPLGDPAPEAAEFTSLDLVSADGWLRVERDGEEWRLTQPQRGAADSARVDRWLSALRFLAWDDLATAKDVTPGAREAHATITAEAGERTWTLRLLGERAAGRDGARYAELEGGTAAPEGSLGVVTGSSAESLIPTLDELRAAEPEDG